VSQPLDFSSGARKPAPPPQTGKRRPVGRSSKGPGGKKRALVILLLIVLLVGGGYLAATAFNLFGLGSSEETLTRDNRYCQLLSQLDQVALSTGATSAGGSYDGPPEKVKAAVAEMGSALGELRSVAPSAVSRDQGIVVDALKKAAAGDPSRVSGPGFAEAMQRIRAFAPSVCSTVVGSTDG